MISLYIAPPSKVDIENTFSSSMLCVWSVWGCFNFQRKMKKILRNINTSESVPKKGIMIKRMILCPSFKICLPPRQDCNPVTIPKYLSLFKCFAIGKRTLQLIIGYVYIWQPTHFFKINWNKWERLLCEMFNISKLWNCQFVKISFLWASYDLDLAGANELNYIFELECHG